MLAKAAEALASDDFGPHISADNRIHSTVCETAGNVLLARELKSLQLHIDFIRGYSQRHSGDHIRRSHEEHVALLEALAKRDPSASRAAMERHIHLSGERISRLLDFHQETALELDYAIRGAKRPPSL
jgi:DNA-binding GntR family transcriptional regulator